MSASRTNKSTIPERTGSDASAWLEPPSDERLRRQAEVFKSLGHPGRMAILHALAGGPVCACELAEAAGCSSPTASRHLQVLRQAGVIADERRGQQIFYRLVLDCTLKFAACIDREDAAEQILKSRGSSMSAALPNT